MDEGALSTTGVSLATGVAGSEFVSDFVVFSFRWRPPLYRLRSTQTGLLFPESLPWFHNHQHLHLTNVLYVNLGYWSPRLSH